MESAPRDRKIIALLNSGSPVVVETIGPSDFTKGKLIWLDDLENMLDDDELEWWVPFPEDEKAFESVPSGNDPSKLT